MSFPITDLSASACRYCRHYRPEGRRGGHCDLLGADVQGDWAACHLAVPPFAPSWERMEGLGTPLAPAAVLGAVAVKPHWQMDLERVVVIEG
ncbi:hypothetical protein [Gloeomargarita sp.]